MEDNKKIIKYTIQQTLWGCNGTKWEKGSFILANNAESLVYFKELGLLENPKFFTPIYEEEVKTIDMGSFNLTVKNKKVFHNQEEITDFVKAMSNYRILQNLGRYTAKIEEITFSVTGCRNSPTKLSDWLKVYDMIK